MTEDDDPNSIAPDLDTVHGRRTIQKKSRPRVLTKKETRLGHDETRLSVDRAYDRPTTRGDCQAEGTNGSRPCPWVSCRHHMYLSVNPETGSITLAFPDLEPWELAESCSLDVADRGGTTLEEVGLLSNLTRERIRQIETTALRRMMRHPTTVELAPDHRARR